MVSQLGGEEGQGQQTKPQHSVCGASVNSLPLFVMYPTCALHLKGLR